MSLQDTALNRIYSTTGSTRDPRSRGRDNFNISLFQYPEDLGEPDLKHYIEFGITMRGKSEYLKKLKDAGQARVIESSVNPDGGRMSAENVSQAAATSFVAGSAIVGGAVAKSILGKVDNTGNKASGSFLQRNAVPIVAAAAAGTAAATALKFNDLLAPDTTYRISDVIALYVDGPPTVKYSMNYANSSLGTLAGALGGGLFESKGSPGASESMVAMGTQLAAIPAALGSLGQVSGKDLNSVRTGTALNPFKEVIFESVDFRTFMFKYKFMPKSENETKKVQEIIKMFKFHMHPEMSNGKLFFINPSEFNISYNFENGPNGYFHKFAPCVLTDMDVSYGGEQFASFQNGTPTEIHVSLTFREKEILTKKMIEDGY
jgi:hypothetical protein